MALNNGRHPVMNWDLGPGPAVLKMVTLRHLMILSGVCYPADIPRDHAVQFDNMLGEVHAHYRPTPLLSTLIRDSISKGLDVARAVLVYNTSGSSNIGLADVTDSLMAIKQLVFEQKKISFKELKALDANYVGYPEIHALVKNKVRLFGSGDQEALKWLIELLKWFMILMRHG